MLIKINHEPEIKQSQPWPNFLLLFPFISRDVVVPILLEPIRKRYVTEQMVCLFATQTYIKWPQRNERKQRRFWKRLIKTLHPLQDAPQYDEDNPNFLTTEINAIRLQV